MFTSKPFFISSTIHFTLIGFIIFNSFFYISDQNEFLNELNVDILDVSEFDAMISKKPDLISENISSISENQKVNKKQLNNFKNDESLKISKIKKFNQNNFIKEDLPDINNIKNDLKQSLEQNDLSASEEVFNKKFSTKKIVGNETNSVTINEKINSKPRAVSRIDDIASIKTENEIVTIDKNIVNNDLSDMESTEKIIKKTQTIESTTKINPEGKKNSKIAVSSGAIISSFKPNTRPKILDKTSLKKPEIRPSSLLLGNNSQSLYDDLTESFLNENNASSSNKISTLEQQLIKVALKKAVERHWDIGILIGVSNYEKYVVKVQFMLDKQGNIYGDIEPVKPKKLDGKFIIAFRQASNALLDAQPISLPVEIDNAIKITMNFDPIVGLGF